MIQILHILSVFCIGLAAGWSAKKYFASSTPDRDPPTSQPTTDVEWGPDAMGEEALFHAIEAASSLNGQMAALSYKDWDTNITLYHLAQATEFAQRLRAYVEAKRITDDLVPDMSELDQIERGM